MDIEAVLRSAVAEIPGAQIRVEPVTPPGERLQDEPPANEDEAQFQNYLQNLKRDVQIPANVDKLNSWSLIERGEPVQISGVDTVPAEEPLVPLHENGIPKIHSCEHCKHITVKFGDPKSPQRVLVAKNRGQFDQAAGDSCVLLGWLRWYLYCFLTNPPSYYSDVFLIFESDRTERAALAGVRGEFIDTRANHKGIKGEGEFGPFNFVAAADDPAARFVAVRPVNLAVSSNESFSVARKWSEECHSSHLQCASFGKGDLPSRLMNICNDTIKLTSTSQLQANTRYVALSYCWGGKQDQKTTSKNLREREKNGLKLEDLPQALRDAVKVTKELGVSYLWVDSVCIVQDDDADKVTEIAKMADIYSGAYVTVSAEGSASVHESFLQSRKPSTIRQRAIPIQVLCPGEERGWIYLYRCEYHEPKKEPLNTRGWALQEHLLSPRHLIYGSWQLRWVCRAKQASDGGPDDVYPRAFETLTSKLQSNRTYEDIRQDLGEAIEENRMTRGLHLMKEMDDIVDFWPLLVKEFTRRSLSEPSDRPAAMYGISRKYGKLCCDNYSAGLWAGNLARQLLWKRPTTCVHPGPRKGFRPASWSWISVDGEVAWELGLASAKPQLKVMACSYKAGIEASISATEMPLHVSTRLRLAKFSDKTPNSLSFLPNGDATRHVNDRFMDVSDEMNHGESEPQEADLALAATATFDYPEELSNAGGRGVVCLLEVLPYSESRYERPLGSRPAGIILDIDKQTGHFRRIGYFDFEWDSKIWTVLYNSGSRDHDERRDKMRMEAFEGRPMETIFII